MMIEPNSVPDAYTELRQILAAKFHVELPEDTAERLVRFHEQILEWNPVAGLVSNSQDADDLWSHSLDSLALVPYVARDGLGRTHWDIGSGGGFPGVVLALALPKVGVHCVERNERKASFLDRMRLVFHIENLHVHVDSFPGSGPAEACSITARAIEEPSRFLAALESSWIDGSTFLCQFKSGEELLGDGWRGERVEDELKAFRRGDLCIVTRA